MGGIDPQRLLEDAECRVSGDVEREEARRTDAPMVPEPDEKSRQAEVPDQLEEGRQEGREGRVAGRPVGG